MYAADFNGDGKLDLAVANPTANTISVLLGNGDGTFQSVVAYPAGQAPQSLVAADFNGDGRIDLAAVNNSGEPYRSSLETAMEPSNPPPLTQAAPAVPLTSRGRT